MYLMPIVIVLVCTICLIFFRDFSPFILLIIFCQLGNFLRYHFIFKKKLQEKYDQFEEEILGY